MLEKAHPDSNLQARKWRLFRAMLRIRRIEEAIVERYAKQEMRCPVHLSIGQEATAVGVCDALETQDRIVSNHRCHGHYLAKGGDLTAMLAEIHGRAAGCCGGRGGSMHLFDDAAGVTASVPIVSSSVPLGAGLALAFKQRREPHVAAAFFGDGGIEEGVVHETANLAAVHRLPLIFVLENNLYSVYTPLEHRQPNRPLAEIARAHALPVLEVDGNDVLATREAAAEAALRARNGGGPTLIVAETYRFRAHCGPKDDDNLGYRKPGELTRHLAACPVESFARILEEDGVLDEASRRRLEEELSREIGTAFTLALQSPMPEPGHEEAQVYA